MEFIKHVIILITELLTFLLTIFLMQPFQPVVSPSPSAIAGWMSSANPNIPHPAVAPGPPGLVQAPGAGLLYCYWFGGNCGCFSRKLLFS